MSIVPCRRVKTMQHLESCSEYMTFKILPNQKSLLEIYLTKAKLI